MLCVVFNWRSVFFAWLLVGFYLLCMACMRFCLIFPIWRDLLCLALLWPGLPLPSFSLIFLASLRPLPPPACPCAQTYFVRSVVRLFDRSIILFVPLFVRPLFPLHHNRPLEEGLLPQHRVNCHVCRPGHARVHVHHRLPHLPRWQACE